MSEAKRKRRIAAGDVDPTATSNSPMTSAGAPAQPIAAAPQGKGNMMNYMAQDNGQGNFGQQIGGPNSFPYGDCGLPEQEAASRGARGVVGPLMCSGENQGTGSQMGRGLNMGYNMHQAPDTQTQEMMYPMSLADSAMKASMKLNGKDDSGKPVPPPYTAGPLGMMPFPGPLDGGMPIGGGVPPQQQSQMFDTLGLQGMQSAEVAQGGMGNGPGSAGGTSGGVGSGQSGMNTKRGKRNTGVSV